MENNEFVILKAEKSRLDGIKMDYITPDCYFFMPLF